MPNSLKDPLNEKQSETGTNDRPDSIRTTTTMMPETNWNSIYTASMLSFIGTVQFSLYFSSMWPYVQIIDRSINETMFGWIIAIYSVGQIISAPLFGYWSNKIQQVRLPLFVGLALMFMGNLCYLSLELTTIPKLYILLFGRFMTGMGSGNVCLLRTYASTASTSKDRLRAIAFVTCGQALGATSGPAFQLLFTSFTYPGTTLLGHLRFNLFTGPAFLACTMNLFGTIILLFIFKEVYAGLHHEEYNKIVRVENGESNRSETATTKGSVNSLTSSLPSKLPPYDLIACFVCYLSRFTQMFVQTNLETIGSPFSMTMFGMTEQKSVEVISIAQALVGSITFATYIFYIYFKSSNMELNFRLSCILSILGLGAFHIVTFPWPFLSNPLQVYTEKERLAYKVEHLPADLEPVGCNTDKFDWCYNIGQVNVWIYFISYVVFIGFAFPILNIAMNTLFSHIIGPRRQGTQQGFFQISGSIARMIGPIGMSTLYTMYGPRMAWTMELLIIGITTLLWIIFYKRMVPLLSSPYTSNSTKRKFTVQNIFWISSIKG
uniref:Major facilitator superfamily (MFS) profile domain-containing protein n=3 Tax=Meloidogyne TaxID=189290 RepID=A0A914LCQ6_MELIC